MSLCRLTTAFGVAALLAANSSATPQTTTPSNSTEPAPTTTLRADTLLGAKDLQADVAILRQAYEALHPGLYRYNTAAQMDEAFRVLAEEFQRDRTLADAYLAFSVFAAKVKCGHTYPNFYNQSQAVQRALFQAGRVPFYFRWLDKRMIVTQSFLSKSDPRLRPGMEVLSINGIPATTILERLMTVARADGNNHDKRVAYMQVQGTDRFEAFDIYFPLLFPSTASRLSLRVRGPEGRRVSTLEVQPLTYQERLAAMKDVSESGDDESRPVWEFRILNHQLAYLRTPTWALYDSKWDWKAFLTQSFETLVKSGATDLVVDLRGNEGGLDVGDEIISHLISKEVPRQAVVRRVRYRKVPEALLPYLDTWDPSFQDWGSAAIDATDGFYRLRRDADDDIGSVIKPAAPMFAGRMWVLVGATNSSATFEFADIVRQNNLGTLVGQPTGGNQRGINGGAFFFLRLPNSGLELDLPLIGLFPEGDRPDGGVQPDILVVPSVRDIAGGRDAEMEAVKTRAQRPPRRTK